jgi:hypothetical protein
MTEDSLAGVAAALARWPEVLIRLREQHRPGPDGRCVGCASQVRLSPRWPCALAVVVEHHQGQRDHRQHHRQRDHRQHHQR